MAKRKKRQGHYCWCCGRRRPNERFSGRNHSRHLCKECSRLGKTELAYRSEVRNIDRLLDWDGLIRRKQRRTFERYLSRADERVRKYAEEVAACDRQQRDEFRRACEADRAALDDLIEESELIISESDEALADHDRARLNAALEASEHEISASRMLPSRIVSVTD
jgi:hypothetical protein